MEMGLYSMPNVADAFLPLVFFAHALMPLVLLKDWIVLQVIGLGHGHGHGHGVHNQEEASQDSAEDMRRPRKVVGLHITQFRSLCSDADDMECCCSVCLHEFDKDEEISQVLACSHFFHRGCLDRWLLDHNHSTCPLCRTPTTL